jgi:hypothetical protein
MRTRVLVAMISFGLAFTPTIALAKGPHGGPGRGHVASSIRGLAFHHHGSRHQHHHGFHAPPLYWDAPAYYPPAGGL